MTFLLFGLQCNVNQTSLTTSPTLYPFSELKVRSPLEKGLEPLSDAYTEQPLFPA